MADPEQIHAEVLSEEQAKGVSASVAEGRAKAARARAEAGSPHPKEPKWWPGAQPHLEGGGGEAPAEAEAEVEEPAEAAAPDEPAEAAAEATPAAAEATPAAAEATPAAAEATPAAAEATPAAAEATPAAAEATPAATEATPAATEATPAATEATPAATEATPAATEEQPEPQVPHEEAAPPPAPAPPAAAPEQPAAGATEAPPEAKPSGVIHGTATGTRLRPEDASTTEAQFQGQAAMYERRKLIDELVATGVPAVSATDTGARRSPALALLYLLIPIIAIVFLLAQNDSPPAEPGPIETPSVLTVVAEGVQFDTDQLTFTAGEATPLHFENKDTVDHNIAIYVDEEDTKNLFKGAIISAGSSADYEIPALDKGDFFFHCDIHPSMNGTVTVE